MDTQSMFLMIMNSFTKSLPILGETDKTTHAQQELVREKSYEQPAAFWHDVNVRRFEIENTINFDKALGWSNHTSLMQFMQLIHPSYQLPFSLLATYVYELVAELKDNPNLFDLVYHITIPLQHINGKYYWFTQHSRPLTVDGENWLTSQINTYTFEGEWNQYDRRLFQCFITDNGMNAEEVTTILTNKIHQYFLGHLSPHAIRILGHYAAGCSMERIRQHYGYKSKDYLREINGNILKKMRAYTGTAFGNAVEIAHYLCEKGVIIEIPLGVGKKIEKQIDNRLTHSP